MDSVTTILRRYLLQHLPVMLEGVGTLRTLRSGAQFATGRRLDPPRRMPELVPEGEPLTDAEGGYTEGVPFVEIIAAELAVDLATAAAWEEEWRASACAEARAQGLAEGSMWLDGVGTIALRETEGYDGYLQRTAEFYPDPEFLELLNPLPTEPLVLPVGRWLADGNGTAAETEAAYARGGYDRRRSQRRPGPGRRGGGRRGPRVAPPRERNPHNYTVSFLAVLIALGALGYVCYYVWTYTDWLSDLLPR